MAFGAVNTFIKEIVKIKRNPETLRFFRGQASVDWDLKPTILRDCNKDILNNEGTLLKHLQITYPDSFEGCLNDFEVLVKAQHYGIPTRLLDITSNPLVALYFACLTEPKLKGNAIVYILDIPKNEILFYDNSNMLSDLSSLKNKKTKTVLCKCVRARLNNPRIIRQSGAFLLFGNSYNIPYLKNIKSIEIARNCIKSIRDDLRLLNISDSTLFPELPSYANELRNGSIEF